MVGDAQQGKNKPFHQSVNLQPPSLEAPSRVDLETQHLGHLICNGHNSSSGGWTYLTNLISVFLNATYCTASTNSVKVWVKPLCCVGEKFPWQISSSLPSINILVASLGKHCVSLKASLGQIFSTQHCGLTHTQNKTIPTGKCETIAQFLTVSVQSNS